VQALAGLVLGSDGATATAGAPVRAHLDLVVDLPTLLGLSDGSVELTGSGPVGVDVLRDLLADPQVAVTMRSLVTDPLTGRLLDYGRRTYAVPDRLRDFIVARDRVCRFPGCRRSAADGTCMWRSPHGRQDEHSPPAIGS
jgi:hypothetical protein